MSPQAKEKALQISEALDSFRDQVILITDGEPELASIALRIANRLGVESNQLKAIIGVTIESHGSHVEFGPLTHLDGPIKDKVEITEEDLDVTAPQIIELKDKVLKFEESFAERTNDEVLGAIITTDDTLIIRGLAKKAGLEDFQDAPIDEDFVVRIREGIAGKQQQQQGDAIADKATLLANIAAAKTNEEVEVLAKGSDDEDVQNAAMEKMIELDAPGE
jgi:hypothetical protein